MNRILLLIVVVLFLAGSKLVLDTTPSEQRYPPAEAFQ
jgi:hypothetical protein